MSDELIEELEEFKQEAEDLLQEAENALLKITDTNYPEHYKSIFRTFHSLKGSAGMLGLDRLQDHMHKAENILQGLETKITLHPEEINFFLSAVDVARAILDGEEVQFNYEISPVKKTVTPTPSYTESNVKTTAKKLELQLTAPLIYVIDDQEDIVDVLKSYLTEAGYQVQGYTDPEAALENMKVVQPNLVITDIRMPRLSGNDVLKQTHELNPLLPVIFISSHVNTESLMDAIEHNISFVIEKPFNETQIINTVRNILERAQLVELIEASIETILFQFKDFYQYLVSIDKRASADILKSDVLYIIKKKKHLLGK